jgi:hypothetical protein
MFGLRKTSRTRISRSKDKQDQDKKDKDKKDLEEKLDSLIHQTRDRPPQRNAVCTARRGCSLT